MGITLNSGRQCPSVATVTINFSDLTSGVDANAIELPPGAILIGGSVDVLTAFNSATSDVIDVGDATTQNRYLNDGSVHAAGRVALVPTGFKTTTTQRYLTVRWVGAGTAPTAGQVRLVAEYIVDGRAEHSIG